MLQMDYVWKFAWEARYWKMVWMCSLQKLVSNEYYAKVCFCAYVCVHVQ